MLERRVVVVVVRAAAILFAAVLLTWLALPSPIGSLPWIPSPQPALDGPYRQNALLADAVLLHEGDVTGPEDIAFDPAYDDNHRVWSGLRDGRIVRFDDDRSTTTVVNTGGRPLGLQFGPDGLLYVADAKKGLLQVDVDKKTVDVLVDHAEGYAFHCVNDVEVAKDGVVYFTDSSAVWGIDQFTEDILDQRPSGRVLKYDPKTKQTTVLARNLQFANGLALVDDEAALIVAETGRYRLWKVWLSGEKRNITEVITENLPGFPDNLAVSPRGTVWVSLYSARKRILDFIHPYPFLKDATASLPEGLRPQPPQWGFVVEVNAEGVPIRSLQDPSGERIPHVSAARERDGQLWLGNLAQPHLARLKL